MERAAPPGDVGNCCFELTLTRHIVNSYNPGAILKSVLRTEINVTYISVLFLTNLTTYVGSS